MARVYLSATDPAAVQRTWKDVIEMILETKTGETLRRWQVAAKDKGLAKLAKIKLLDTRSEHFLRVLTEGTVSTNVYLRRMHNFAMDMAWIPAPVLPRRQWPAVRYAEKRGITWDEHFRIVDRERNPERQAFYEMAWHIGASQGDLAHLHAEDIDWGTKTLCFDRMKLRGRGLKPPLIAFGPSAEIVLSKLPQTGPLFPYLIGLRPADHRPAPCEHCWQKFSSYSECQPFRTRPPAGRRGGEPSKPTSGSAVLCLAGFGTNSHRDSERALPFSSTWPGPRLHQGA
jgi:hypothetical protein